MGVYGAVGCVCDGVFGGVGTLGNQVLICCDAFTCLINVGENHFHWRCEEMRVEDDQFPQ